MSFSLCSFSLIVRRRFSTTIKSEDCVGQVIVRFFSKFSTSVNLELCVGALSFGNMIGFSRNSFQQLALNFHSTFSYTSGYQYYLKLTPEFLLYSRVIFVDSVTILFLPFFLDRFDNLNYFKENLAPMYLSKVTANSARPLYSKWPPPPSKKA